MPMETMIRLENIAKEFDGEQIIHPLSLSVYEGEFLTLLGPSGCGKTTILRMIAGFEEPDSGEIYLGDKPVQGVPPFKRDVNMVFQQYALFPHLNVEQNILFGLQMKNIPKAEQKDRLREVLEYTQLQQFTQRMPGQLSGGQQQRVAIARAIINQPKVLLLDEPLGALDYQLRKSLQFELKNLQKKLGITFIYVTHDQEEALTMSDRIVILNKGNIEQIGTPASVYNEPRTVFAAQFIGENNIFMQGERIFCVRPENIDITSKPEVTVDPTEIREFEMLDDGDIISSLGDSSSDNGWIHDGVVYKEAKIKDIAYTGNFYKIFLLAKDETKPILAYSYREKVKWREGQEVTLSWDLESEVMLLDEE